MKQDRRLNNGLLMHVNNLIMNDPDTVKVTSKQTVFFIFFFLGNLSRGKRLAWCTISPPTSPTSLSRLQKAPMPLNWVLRIICIRKGKR